MILRFVDWFVDNVAVRVLGVLAKSEFLNNVLWDIAEKSIFLLIGNKEWYKLEQKDLRCTYVLCFSISFFTPNKQAQGN